MLILKNGRIFRRFCFYAAALLLTMFFFQCDKPKEISEKEFKDRTLNKSDSVLVEFLGVEDNKAILKVSTLSSSDSKKRNEEFFFAAANPAFEIWIDENLFGITVPNFNKLYNFLIHQKEKEFSFEKWSILTRDDLQERSDKKSIRVTVKGYTHFVFEMKDSKIRSYSLSMKYNPKNDFEYKTLWRKLLDHIDKQSID